MLHELSHRLTAGYDGIAIEDLNVKGMVRNRKLARSIADAGFGMLRQFIEYKAFLRGCTVELVDRFFPSSRMCSGCGQLHDITLADRALACACGLTIDRDLNAAINLNGIVETRSSQTLNARKSRVRPLRRRRRGRRE